VFTLSDGLIVRVSDLANGSAGFNEWLMAFHGKQIMPPQRPSYYPQLKFVSWHVKEVFKGYQRH
jgi:putative restriction endonuclease